MLAARACGRAAERSTGAAAHDATQPDSDLDAGSSADAPWTRPRPRRCPPSPALAGSSAFFEAAPRRRDPAPREADDDGGRDSARTSEALRVLTAL